MPRDRAVPKTCSLSRNPGVQGACSLRAIISATDSIRRLTGIVLQSAHANTQSPHCICANPRLAAPEPAMPGLVGGWSPFDRCRGFQPADRERAGGASRGATKASSICRRLCSTRETPQRRRTHSLACWTLRLLARRGSKAAQVPPLHMALRTRRIFDHRRQDQAASTTSARIPAHGCNARVSVSVQAPDRVFLSAGPACG